jgi:hypothetical protein
MRHGNFEYRVVFDKQNGHFIIQLFVKNDIYYFISKLPSVPHGYSLEKLQENITLFMEAMQKPVLLIENIKEISSMPLCPFYSDLPASQFPFDS